MPKTDFKLADIQNFWNDTEYAVKTYVSEPPSEQIILSIEKELGYKLPNSYIEFMKIHNGGIPLDLCFPTNEPTSWAKDHIQISGIYGIGRKKAHSLCGSQGSPFFIDEWGYPNIGVYICDCPSAGHDMVALDYRNCGKNGEPEVVHVSLEPHCKITFLAKNFESFIQGLENEKTYDTSQQDKQETLDRVENGEFSQLLKKMCQQAKDVPQIDSVIRKIAKKIVNQKGYFALHADELSYLLYDIQFWLLENLQKIKNKEEYLKMYPSILALEGKFSTGGYAPNFVTDWLNQQINKGAIKQKDTGELLFEPPYLRGLIEKVKTFQDR